jgi:DNA primase
MVRFARLGFSSGQGLYDHLIDQGYLHSVIFKKNLVKSMKKKDLPCMDFFGKGRIIFPCLEEGRVRGMQSRICYDTDNLAIPRYKMLGNSSFQFYSPDFVVEGQPVTVVEGPLDALTLIQHGIPAVCFLGTSGFKPEYAEHMKKAQTIYCMPDAEDNKHSRKANMSTYIQIATCTEKMPVLLSIPIGMCGAKVDPADLFGTMTGYRAQIEMERLISTAVNLDETKEWDDHLRKLRENQRKKEQRDQTSQEGDALEKFPIIKTLELLGVKIIEGYNVRPTCLCFAPDHEDTEPSVHIYENTETFHCFGCHAGHDAIDAVRMVLGLEFKDAIDWLKEHVNEKQNAGSVSEHA